MTTSTAKLYYSIVENRDRRRSLPTENAIISSVEFQMSLLMFVALAGYLIAYRINQSAVVGIIPAGIVVGPSLLGLITYIDFVSSLAHLGGIGMQLCGATTTFLSRRVWAASLYEFLR